MRAYVWCIGIWMLDVCLSVSQNGMLSLVLGALLALAMREATRVSRRASDDPQKPHAGPAPVGYAIARGVIWLAVSASIISLLLGYIALGSFIVRQAAWLAIVLGSAYLLNGLIDDACPSVVAANNRSEERPFGTGCVSTWKFR